MASQTVPTGQRVSGDPKRFALTDDGQSGYLIGTKCRSCREVLFGTLQYCRNCGSGETESVQLSGTGTLHSLTVVRRAAADWTGPVPYVLGLVQLDDGPRVLSEVVDAEEADLVIGAKMELVTRTALVREDGTEVVVYKWRPARAGEQQP